MRAAFISGGCVEPRAATDGGKENTKLGNPNLMLPQITVSASWESLATGKNYARAGWPPEPLRLRFASATAPPGTCSRWNPDKQQRKSPVLSPSEIYSRTWPRWAAVTHLQIQLRSAGFIFRGLIFGNAEHHHLPQGTWLLSSSRKQAPRCQHIEHKRKNSQSQHQAVLPWACPDAYYHYSSRLCSSIYLTERAHYAEEIVSSSIDVITLLSFILGILKYLPSQLDIIVFF